MEQVAHISGGKRLLLMIVLSLATFMYVLDYTIANVAIPYIAGGLAVSPEQGTYVITSFAVGNAIALPMTGWISTRLGQEKTMILAVLLFTFFSWVCGVSFSLAMLCVARFAQGVAAGPIIPLSQVLMTKAFPKGQEGVAISVFATVVVFAPVLGPVIGGWICINYLWGWIFFINIPVGIFCSFVIWVILKDRMTTGKRLPVDLIGFALLAIGVTCLQIFLDKGQQWDWFHSNRIRALSIIAFLSLSYLVLWQLVCKKPLINLKLFCYPTFALATVLMFVSYAVYFGTVVLIPLWLQVYMGYNAFWAGIAVCPMGIVPILFGLFMAKVVTKIGRIIPLAIAFIFFAISCFDVIDFTTEVNLSHIMWSRFILGIGLVFFITPLFSLFPLELSATEMAMGAGIFNFVRSLAGGIGTSIFTTMYQRRIIHHHNNLTYYVNEFSNSVIAYMQKIFSYGIRGKPALTLLNDVTDQQAAMLALNDSFFALGWISVALIFITFLGYSKERKERLKAEASTSKG